MRDDITQFAEFRPSERAMTESERSEMKSVVFCRSQEDQRVLSNVTMMREAPSSGAASSSPTGVGRGRAGLAAAAVVLILSGVGGLLMIDRNRSIEQGVGSQAQITDVPRANETAPVPDSTTLDPPGEAGNGATGVEVVLRLGDEGPAVIEMQQRLTDLGFFVGAVDGVFGERTEQAVWAFEKLILGVQANAATGEWSNDFLDVLDDTSVVAPRRPAAGRHVEIYLPEQVLALFDEAGRAEVVTHISSGSNEEFCERVAIDPGTPLNTSDAPVVRDECGVARTPGGVFQADEMVSGRVDTGIGSMQSPIFFNYTIAIYGAQQVPTSPVSHGGIRVPIDTIDAIRSVVEVGDPVLVWNGETEPEEVAEEDQLPVFNYPDPNSN